MKEKMKTWEFWLMLAVNLIGGALHMGYIPAGGKLAHTAMGALQLLATLGFVYGQPLKVPTEGDQSPKLPLEKVAMLVAFLAGCLALSSCAHLTPQQTQALKIDEAACALGAVPSAVAGLADQTLSSLLGQPGAPTWEQFASTTLIKDGIDYAICAVRYAVHDLGLHMRVKGQADPAYLAAHQRAQIWLSAHGAGSMSLLDPSIDVGAHTIGQRGSVTTGSIHGYIIDDGGTCQASSIENGQPGSYLVSGSGKPPVWKPLVHAPQTKRWCFGKQSGDNIPLVPCDDQ